MERHLSRTLFTILLFCFSAFLLFCFSTIANAQISGNLKAFFKVEDPNTLNYWYSHYDDCPWGEVEAEREIEGVIKRSRLRTEHSVSGSNNLYLNVDVLCLSLESIAGNPIGYSVNFEIMYGDYPMLYEVRYGNLLSVGLDGKQSRLDSLKQFVEKAVTDFVEVNFLSESN